MNQQKVNQYLKNPRSYIYIRNENVYFKVFNRKKNDIHLPQTSLKECQEFIQPYIDKYNIDNYQGNLQFYKEDDVLHLLYKDKKLAQHTIQSLGNGVPATIDNLSFALIITMVSMLNKLLTNEELANQLSFELKDKHIIDHLYEFYRYKSIYPQKTSLWLYNKIYGQ